MSMKIATNISCAVPAATAQGPGYAAVAICPASAYQPSFRGFFRWPAPGNGQMQDDSQARVTTIGVPTAGSTMPGGAIADGVHAYAIVSNSSMMPITGSVEVQDFGQ